MKTKCLYMMLVAFLAAMVSSCSGTTQKEISPTDTEFTSGTMASIIQVVDEPCEINLVEEHEPYHSYTVRLNVKLKNMTGPGEFTDPQKIELQGFYIAQIKVTDENGAKLFDLDVSSDSKLKLQKLIAGEKGSTAEIIFEDTNISANEAKKLFKKVAKFTPGQACNVVDATAESSSTVVSTSNTSSSQSESSQTASSNDLSNIILPNQLKGKVEVLSAEKSITNYGYPAMTIQFKLLSKVNTAPLISEGGQMWIIGVGETESGSPVKSLLPNYGEWRSGDSDGEIFKNFLEGDPDDTITLEFKGDKSESTNVSADLEQVKKFRLRLKKG